MSLRINQNVLAIQTHGTLSQTATRLEKSVNKLSSGLRIATAADDAAGLAISEKMRRQIRGFSRATLNAQDGISMIQTAEGALDETHSNLQRMRELAIQASNDTLTSNDRLEIQKEINQLREDINRISRNTEFNTKKLLDGSQTALVSSTTNYVKGLVTGIGDSAGDYDISMVLLKGGSAQLQRTQIFTIAGTTGTLAKGNTQLQSIAQFYDGNGVFALTNAQVLTINGNSKSASVNIDSQMTLDKVAGAIAGAIQSAAGLGISNAGVKTVNTASTGVSGMGGYIQVTSGMVGNAGQISFASDQNLLNGLGFTITRSAADNLVQLTSSDASGSIRTIEASDQRAVGLLDGIDVKFSSQAAQIGGSTGLQQGILISTGFQIRLSSVGGAIISGIFTVTSGFWTMDGIARSLNSQNLTAVPPIQGFTANIYDGQLRLNYEPVLVSLSNTFNVLTNPGSTMLTQVIGMTTGSKSGFTTGNKDASKAAWGFSTFDANTASYTVRYSIGDSVNALNIIMYTTTSVATTADMKTFNQLQSSVNAQMVANSVAVRLDQTEKTLAFTSLRVGTETLINGTRRSSFVSLVISASGGANSVADSRALFDIDPTTATGVGEKNYRLHVVNNLPQFQIGADQGQIMKINMGDMSSEALGVDNIDLTNIPNASIAMAKISKAIDKVSSERAKFGAFQNRLEHAINNLRTMTSNMTAAESRIRDVDVAQEMIEFTRNQIMNQSGTAMLAQANLIPQGVLQLLK